MHQGPVPVFTLSASDPVFDDAGRPPTSPPPDEADLPAVRNIPILHDQAESPRVVLHHGINFADDGQVIGREPPELPESLYAYVEGPRFHPKRARELPVAKMARGRVKKLVTAMLVDSKPNLKYDKFGRKRLVSQYLAKGKSASRRSPGGGDGGGRDRGRGRGRDRDRDQDGLDRGHGEDGGHDVGPLAFDVFEEPADTSMETEAHKLYRQWSAELDQDLGDNGDHSSSRSGAASALGVDGTVLPPISAADRHARAASSSSSSSAGSPGRRRPRPARRAGMHSGHASGSGEGSGGHKVHAPGAYVVAEVADHAANTPGGRAMSNRTTIDTPPPVPGQGVGRGNPPAPPGPVDGDGDDGDRSSGSAQTVRAGTGSGRGASRGSAQGSKLSNGQKRPAAGASGVRRDISMGSVAEHGGGPSKRRSSAASNSAQGTRRDSSAQSRGSGSGSGSGSGLDVDAAALPPAVLSVDDSESKDAMQRQLTPLRFPPKLREFWERHPELNPHHVDMPGGTSSPLSPGHDTSGSGAGRMGAASAGSGRSGSRKRSRGMSGAQKGRKGKKVPGGASGKTHFVYDKQRTEGYTLHDFAVTMDSELPISIEMQARLTQSLSRDDGISSLGDEASFWNSEVHSTLSNPFDASSFCARPAQLETGGIGIRFSGAVPLHPRDTLENTDPFRYGTHVHAAATRIQRFWRWRADREEWAATTAQRWFRGARIRWRMKRVVERKVAAATLIQALHRGIVGREHVAHIRRLGWNFCGTEVQRVFRGFLGRDKARRERIRQRNMAATQIQAAYRSLVARRVVEVQRQRRLNWSAESIQMMWRWRNFRLYKTVYEKELTRNVVRIQALFQGRQGRIRAACLIAARLLQSVARGFMARRFLRLLHTCSTLIEKVARSYLQREWCRQEKARRLREEANRRSAEDEACKVACKVAIEGVIKSFKTKEGKKKKREEMKRVRVSARTAKAQRKVMTAKQRELSKFKRAFDLYDIEGSGRVGPKEFRFIAKEAGFAIGKLECAGAMDRTGTITLERMVQWATIPANRLAQRKVPRKVRRGGLTVAKAVRDVFGFTMRRRARRNVLAQAGFDARMEERVKFRETRPAPFKCTRGQGLCEFSCAFSYQLERHTKRCGVSASRRQTFLGAL